jgi:50S ribosomal protein L16 3-hydroxylase
MSTATFLREHWQKKPLLVRGAFPAFRDPISPDELAGLSCEDGVESRIVREKGIRAPWEVTWGPQDPRAFAKLPERGWTLLVQEANRWVPDVALLLEPFTFLPNVRVDDVMISFAAPGGSVGPHTDSYDVFLVQGQGQRRWKYGANPIENPSFKKGLDLRILPRFDVAEDEVLGPGDMLYLPPGFAHHGIARTPCLTYSVGFRAPNAGEAWTSFAEWSCEQGASRRLLDDPALRPAQNPGEIPPALLSRVRTMVRSIDTSDDAIHRWYASFSTQLKPGHTLEPPRRPLGTDALLRRLVRGANIGRSEEARWAFLPRGNQGLLLFVGGIELPVSPAAAALARALCASRRFDGPALAALAKGRDTRALLQRLFALGALFELR